MSQPSPIDPSRIPSIDLVEATLNRAEDSYLVRSSNVDTKAGLLLGGAGVLVALVGRDTGITGLLAQALAVLAGAAAVAALWPRIDKAIGPRELRDRYLTVDQSVTRMVVLNSRLELHAQDEHVLITKVARFRWSALLLLAAAATIVAGSIVDRVSG